MIAGAAWIACAMLWTAPCAQAQEVHKCTVNGQVLYQAQACAAGDVVLPAVPTPSDQERRQAGVDLSRQRVQAATGRIIRPVYVAPPPLPRPPPAIVQSSTTVIVLPEAGHGTVVIHQTSRALAQIAYPGSQKPLTNCEKLNRDYGELQDRRTQLRAPGDLPARDELLRKAEADLEHVRAMAQASTCALTR